MVGNALILLVEDTEEDCILMQRTFEKGNIVNPILALRSGEKPLSICGALASKSKAPWTQARRVKRKRSFDNYTIRKTTGAMPSSKSTAPSPFTTAL
ncbi:hypothetical protein SBV1_770006 [Verrucomicrobia bacterium]|nr:hypothetical protein SBV1_770006 [Verrucomicrobiota bacterium]